MAEIQSMINRRIRRRVTDVVPHNTKRTIHNARLCNRNVEKVTKSDISKVCFSKGTDVHVVQQLHNESQNYVLNVKADNTKAQPNIKCPQCMVQIQGTAVNILVDSGSPYTIIPNELYENLFADIELCDSDITPGGYGVHLYKYEGISRQRYNTKRGKPKKAFTCRCMAQLYWVGQRKRNLRSFSTLPKSNLSYKPHRLW